MASIPFGVRFVFPAAFLLGIAAPAQCGLQWQAGEPVSMPHGQLRATTSWDPDGAGPLPVVLVAVGRFVVGSTSTDVATWDGAQWAPIGSIAGAVAEAVAVYNGDLIIAGGNQVQRRVGTTWQPIGTYAVSINSAVIEAMTVFGSDLVIGGRFDSIAGVTANNIARWNGTAWAPLGTGVPGGWINALAVYSYQNQNALYVGGQITQAGGAAASNVAIWTGGAWVAPPGTNDRVLTMVVRTSTSLTASYLFLGGRFTSAGGVACDRVARYQSFTNVWSAVGTLPIAAVDCSKLFVRDTTFSYELVAALGDQACRWTASAWNLMGPALTVAAGVPAGLATAIRSLAFFGGRYVVGLADGYALVGGLWSFDGVAWQSVDGRGIDRRVRAVLRTATDLVIGGGFRSISGVTMNGVARGGIDAWQPLANGPTGGNGGVEALLQLPNGDLVAGGTFGTATGGAGENIARWNGTAWSPLGGGVNGTVHALAVLPNGEIVAGGSFTTAGGGVALHIARWNGTGWLALDVGVNGAVTALCVLANGALIVGGEFQNVGANNVSTKHVAAWMGGAWSALGIGPNDTVYALAAMPDGGFVAGGAFTSVNAAPAPHLARWDGSAWSALPGGGGAPLNATVRALALLPGDDLLVGGDRFTVSGPLLGTVHDNLVRLHGTTWQPLGLGVEALGVTTDVVDAATLTPAGDVVVVGSFWTTTGPYSGNVARLTTPCPAAATVYGSGCAGSAGLEALAATTLPWKGTAFRARATGLPAVAASVVVYGFSQAAIPLVALLPEGVPGCTLLAMPDILELALPTAGVLDTAVSLAPSPSLVGQTFDHQVVTLDVGGGTVSAVTSTNALAVTVGSY